MSRSDDPRPSDPAPPSELRVTPMMVQYLEIKTANPDSLLFYRMGDFYELFFDDAEVASRALGIALTKRGKHLGEDIAMCGVPVHAADDYLQRLIRLGHKVSVCEQTEDPAEARKRGSKAVVRRAVTRLVTPGTLTEDTLLESGRHNYLAALARIRAANELGLAWLDISTGEFAVAPASPATLAAELARLEPSELIVADSVLADAGLAAILRDLRIVLTPLPASRFDSQAAEKRICEEYAIAAAEALGAFTRAEIAAAGALIDYVRITQVGRLPALGRPRRVPADATVMIDAATRANLELARSASGGRAGSLLDTVDLTLTGPGARLLAERLAAPLTDPAEINRRLDAVAAFVADRDQARTVRDRLRGAPDMGRALARLSLGRGSPRDLAVIRDGLRLAATLSPAAGAAGPLAAWPDTVAEVFATLGRPDGGLADAIGSVLADELPATTRDGGFIRAGADARLDDNRRLRDDSRKVIAGLQSGYAELAAVKSLRIKHNNMLGYFIEVPQQHGQAMLAPPLAATFIHRQTMANAMRFTTTELSGLEQRISLAAERALAIELELFAGLAEQVAAAAEPIREVAAALAALDLYTALAELAVRHDYTRPRVDDSRMFAIRQGRHPVVEAALRSQRQSAFVPNDCDLSAGPDGGRHIWLLTGPNMAGKSTFLRQNAVIAVLAQMGSFVPAEAAHIGVVDRLFSRVGAADDLARGRSTFMVEMVETATILNQAGERSLVILDEIGRGTATFDGLSIAWACVEHLHAVNRCRALFATHFHELTALAGKLERLANATVKVREWQGEVIFLHEVAPGAADRSYGIQVARLAGLPPCVIERAAEVLAALESSEQSQARRTLADDLPLFAAARPTAAPPRPSAPGAVERLLAEVAPDELAPREALDLVYRLKAALERPGG